MGRVKTRFFSRERMRESSIFLKQKGVVEG